MDPINSLFLNSDVKAIQQNKSLNQVTPSQTHEQFSNVLKDAINKVNETQQVSDQKTNALVNGEINDLHEVMIASQKASVSLQTATQIQSKAIDAYKEVMRMQL
ncbi:flagellar hook-basal body complex protein FliE [Aquisalibacillus elongatus]|uniref:Flagellar hook-basal body complex protein FliE n=1 Tax=Aquisalibacillus elongatus TaxID=485577 RepID=A0A3N5BGX7_9BACI|nr:flagellar hook-basal body complex protein FliE [Aquisalibacillus elongatus]RPF55999.1 flagellar hook-basal body complex protein FliE [Aquisalibacillus elongatus]